VLQVDQLGRATQASVSQSERVDFTLWSVGMAVGSESPELVVVGLEGFVGAEYTWMRAERPLSRVTNIPS
jgi:hypothetical protein